MSSIQKKHIKTIGYSIGFSKKIPPKKHIKTIGYSIGFSKKIPPRMCQMGWLSDCTMRDR